MFIDNVVIKVIAGDGGDGCTAFRREKFIPDGGPYGGNGGKGSSIIFEVHEGLSTLLDFKYRKIIKGNKGENGSGKLKTGKDAEDIVIKVPIGTVIIDNDTNLVVADLKHKGERVIIAKGGRGGRGNKALATSFNTAPDVSEKGEPGEKTELRLELKLIADVGLVGLPSVGKSTILSKISNAQPKIAAYHFTTLSPNLGVVKTKDGRIFTVADLPGLIEGASKGEGLGYDFLRHIERTRVIAHVIDMSGLENDPVAAYNLINNELKQYSKALESKSKIIIANKMDVESSKDNLKEFKSKIKLPIYETSAIDGKGLDNLMIEFANILDSEKEVELYPEDSYLSHVLYKFKEEKPFVINKIGEKWVISGEKVEKLFKMTKFNSEEAIVRFTKKLRNMGIDDKLKELGAQDGDTVKIMKYEFTYVD